ncbi:endonuclease [Lysobacter sp. Root916]|uniref:S1/P1 nuclease n=1 Tax=Lysobacter sp. Root916 TaxID=1736606 RepID=UPI0007097F91|nr:S1/P1 nuclease [Lysobacter sp. Root916]KRD34202.1 endonuclease [Lysobacter sp. Root916]
MIRALFIALLFLLPFDALAWGTLGHRLVALLALGELDPAVRRDIDALLVGEPDPTLAGIANWADELRAHDPNLGKQSAKWHYVNLGEENCAYEPARDCPMGGCVIEAIRKQTEILSDRKRTREERLQALKFVVHFVGDVHQPLHAGYARDKGGSDVQIQFNGRGSNLHQLWDSGMLNAAGLDENAWLLRLRALPLAVTVSEPALPPDSPAWAQASCRIALQPGLYPAKATVDENYVQTWRPEAEAQLRRGGSHLAAVLNAALKR